MTRRVLLRLGVLALPALVYLFASRTAIGPTLLIFPWSQHEGLHYVDVVVFAIAAYLWLLALSLLWRDRRG